MSKTTTMTVEIRFGDCDPAGIVFFPRYHRCTDAASASLYDLWCSELVACAGAQHRHHRHAVARTTARFIKSATYGEKLLISTHIQEWRNKVFVQKHVVTRGDDLICESSETRVFCVRDTEDRRRIHAIPVPRRHPPHV